MLGLLALSGLGMTLLLNKGCNSAELPRATEDCQNDTS
jgi:hypothetical protein